MYLAGYVILFSKRTERISCMVYCERDFGPSHAALNVVSHMTLTERNFSQLILYERERETRRQIIQSQ